MTFVIVIHNFNKNGAIKRILFLVALSFSLAANAQNYLISFAGTGASTTVSTVKVENLTAGTSLTLNGSDILSLTNTTGVHSIDNDKSSLLKIYPNPMTDNSTLTINPPVPGNATISVYDISGMLVAQTRSYLDKSLQEFHLSGINNGLYLISIKGNSYQISEKLLCNSKVAGTINIEKVTNNQVVIERKPTKDSKSVLGTVDMSYNAGDRLKFIGISANYSTVKTDIPTSDKTITFNFIACTDADNNNYPIVEIGTQVWMEENLKTTTYNDVSAIPNVTDNTLWAALSTPGYCWYNNDASSYKDTYGALYNWYTVDASSNGGKNVCPSGWHVPTDAEWTALTTYLGDESIAGGKLKETGTIHWISPNMGANNETGFTAIPSGDRECCNPGILFSGIRLYSGWWSATENVSVTNDAYSRSVTENWSNFDKTSLFKHIGFSIRCLKGEAPTLPTLITVAASSIHSITAKSGGNITSDGGSAITARGVCWGSSPNPTIDEAKTLDGAGTGLFASSISGLILGNIYYVRAYATNDVGTAYGNEIFFTTMLAPGDNFQGGIVGYILQPGEPGYIDGETHGLIVAPTDQSQEIPWWNGSYTVTGATETALGTGNSNTNTIVASQGAGDYAAKICYDLVLGSYIDWYLPSKDELYKL